MSLLSLVSPAASAPTVNNDVSLVVAGQTIGGWTEIEITRGCERLPPSFSIALTAIDPTTMGQVKAYAGSPCAVLIGTDQVITGVIDRDTNSADASGHRLAIIGRGATCDLVDCSAEWPNGQIVGANALEVVQKVADPYKIVVTAAAGAPLGDPIPQFQLDYGTTAVEIIERVTRAAALLYYELPDGSLLLAQVGTRKASSGLVYGQNVQAYSVTNAMDQRYSEYVCEEVSTEVAIGDVNGPGETAYDVVPDLNVKRHRLLYLVSTSFQAPEPKVLCSQTARWEAQRRAGRGTQVGITVDSWRDSDGKLWEPNTLVPVDVPGLRLPDKTLCISEVTYRRDNESGTTAELVLMPPSAFTPEPIALLPVNLSDIPSGAPAQ